MAGNAGQSALFVEDLRDALKDAVRALGGNKAVGRRLRPELTADSAGDWVKDCLNPARRERFDPEQVLWLIREAKLVGCHSIVNYICDEAGYTRPSPVEPADEAAELKRQAIAAVKDFAVLVQRLERAVGGS